MESYSISTEIHNFCRVFDRDLSKPKMKRFKELLHGIVRGKKAIISEIVRANRINENDRRCLRKQVEQLSAMLDSFPLETMMTRKLIPLRQNISADTALYCDLVDISKDYHQGLEHIGATWDGSRGEAAKGYEVIDVSLFSGTTCRSLLRHCYSTAEPGFKSLIPEMETVFKQLVMAWGELRGTFIFDQGADNNRFIDLLVKYEASFTIRLNVNRGVKDRIVINENEDGIKEKVKMMELFSGKIQGVTGWKNRKTKEQKVVQLQWKQILWLSKGEEIPLTLVWCHREGDPSPVVFLTSRSITDAEVAAKVYQQYFSRSSEEAIFKCHKEKLGMEKIQLRSFHKIQQMMCFYVLVDQFLAKLREEALKVGSLIATLVKSFLQGEQRKITKWSIVDWYIDTWSKLERQTIKFRKRFRRRYDPNQLSLYFNFNEKW
jgi:hypothetical protein